MTQFYEWLSIPFGYVIHYLYLILFHNYWAALFMLVVIVKLILMPSTISQQRSSAKQVRLQPKVNRIRAKYSTGGQMTREQQMKIQQETQELYRREGYSAMSGGCLPMLIQLPIMMGLYGVVYTPLSQVLRIPQTAIDAAAAALKIDASAGGRALRTVEIDLLNKINESNMPAVLSDYAKDVLHIKNQFTFLGAELSQRPEIKSISLLWLIPVAAFLASLLSAIPMFLKQRQTNPEMAKNPTMGCMTFLPSLMSLWFCFMFPAAVGVYWVMSSLMTFVTTMILNYTHSPQKVIATQMVDETVQRRAREKSVKQMHSYTEQAT